MEPNKNSMLPTYQGNYRDMLGALKFGDIKNPCWFFAEDESELFFIHWERDSEGNKNLVPHGIMWEKVKDIEETLDGLKDPDGNVIKVTDYVADNIAPVQTQVETVQTEVTTVSDAVTEIQKNGAAIMLTKKEV